MRGSRRQRRQRQKENPGVAVSLGYVRVSVESPQYPRRAQIFLLSPVYDSHSEMRVFPGSAGPFDLGCVTRGSRARPSKPLCTNR